MGYVSGFPELSDQKEMFNRHSVKCTYQLIANSPKLSAFIVKIRVHGNQAVGSDVNSLPHVTEQTHDTRISWVCSVTQTTMLTAFSN